ncbi:hypothetical protein VTK56DRAFT_4371 [Thermocarpiscus australiensis]
MGNGSGRKKRKGGRLTGRGDFGVVDGHQLEDGWNRYVPLDADGKSGSKGGGEAGGGASWARRELGWRASGELQPGKRAVCAQHGGVVTSGSRVALVELEPHTGACCNPASELGPPSWQRIGDFGCILGFVRRQPCVRTRATGACPSPALSTKQGSSPLACRAQLAQPIRDTHVIDTKSRLVRWCSAEFCVARWPPCLNRVLCSADHLKPRTVF